MDSAEITGKHYFPTWIINSFRFQLESNESIKCNIVITMHYCFMELKICRSLDWYSYSSNYCCIVGNFAAPLKSSESTFSFNLKTLTITAMWQWFPNVMIWIWKQVSRWYHTIPQFEQKSKKKVSSLNAEWIQRNPPLRKIALMHLKVSIICSSRLVLKRLPCFNDCLVYVVIFSWKLTPSFWYSTHEST